MAKAKISKSNSVPVTKKKSSKRARMPSISVRQKRLKPVAASSSDTPGGPVTLDEARLLAKGLVPKRTSRRPVTSVRKKATHASVAIERARLNKQIKEENHRRIQEYSGMMAIMKSRGIKGLTPSATAKATSHAGGTAGGLAAAGGGQPLQIVAEGDSWFDYPAPFFGGGIVPRLERRLGVPILSLAKAGDEVRNMLGVEERKILTQQLGNGSPAGGKWDVLLFSGGGNDIVGDPMALWIRDFNAAAPAASLISAARVGAALELVRAGYEDLITIRDQLSPTTHLVLHGYDFAIPDGRGVCGYGPWMKPTFDLHRFPTIPSATAVVKAMLLEFAAMLQSLASSHSEVTFIKIQGTLPSVTSSWHNELHPSGTGFESIATVFHATLTVLFPGRVL